MSETRDGNELWNSSPNIKPLPEGGPWTFVQLRDGYAAPQRFIASFGKTTQDRHGATRGASVSLLIEVGADGNGHCKAVEIHEPERGVTSELLRKLPIARITRAAVAGAARPVEAGEVSGGKLLAAILTTRPDEAAEFYRRYTENARRPRRGSRITDEQLRQVADLYRAAAERGAPPTQTVADSLQVARSTAARWVAKARERGLLGPALPGRAGERERS